MKNANPNLMRRRGIPSLIHTKRGKQMKSWNYWQQFAHTGRIDDYLSYASCAAQENVRCEEPKKEDSGVRQDAGIYMCNRNDTEADAYW